MRSETYDDARLSMPSSVSGPTPSGDTRPQENDSATMPGGVILSSSRIISGTSEILSLLGTLGEGYRLSCLYRCQVNIILIIVAKETIFLLADLDMYFFFN